MHAVLEDFLALKAITVSTERLVPAAEMAGPDLPACLANQVLAASLVPVDRPEHLDPQAWSVPKARLVLLDALV